MRRRAWENLHRWVSPTIPSLTNQNTQIPNRQNVAWVPMRHTVAVCTKGAQVSYWIHHVLTMLGQRVKVVDFDIGACMRSSVEVVEIKPASNAGCAVLANRNRPILRTALINAAQTVHFAAFYFTSNLVSSARCLLRCNIRLCSG